MFIDQLGYMRDEYNDLFLLVDQRDLLPEGRFERLFENACERCGLGSLKNEEYVIDAAQDYVNVFNYLIGVEKGISEFTVSRPVDEFAMDTFEKHVNILMDRTGMDESELRRGRLYANRVEACMYYMEKFGDRDWYERLPDMVLSLEEKYPEFED